MSVEQWVLGKVLDRMFGISVSVGKDIHSRWKARNQIPSWIAILNSHFANELKIFCQNQFEPRIHIDGPFTLSVAQRSAAAQHCRRLMAINRPNDPHAILENVPLWQSDPVILHARHLDFASVCALRDEGCKPAILSSSAVIVCAKTKELILHKRAPDLATYPGCLHTLGGAYIPPGTGGVDSDRLKLSSTIAREVQEEAQIRLALEEFPPMMMAQELSTGFMQLVFLGVPVSRLGLRGLEDNWEGGVVQVPFKNLSDFLRDPTWVPSGKAHVLAWLALGAPGGGASPRFGNLKAREVFTSAVGTYPGNG